MAVHVSRKRKEEDMLDVDVSLLFYRMVKARVHIESDAGHGPVH